jgi:hypothetical protein
MRATHKNAQQDFRVEDSGGVVLFHMRSKAARIWVRENVNAESWQFLGDALAVDRRYAENLVAGIVSSGLSVA